MNPLTLIRSLTPLRRALVLLALVIALIAAGLFLRNLLTGAARTEARLGTEQADAAIQSGNDTARTIGDQSQIEAARERSVAEMQKDVNDAQDPADAHAAGAGWLCDNFGICPEE